MRTSQAVALPILSFALAGCTGRPQLPEIQAHGTECRSEALIGSLREMQRPPRATRSLSRNLTHDDEAPSPGVQVVRFVYLVPSDRTPRQGFTNVLKRAGTHVQRWYMDQTKTKTFALRDSAFEELRLSRPADFYKNAENSSSSKPELRFWNNVLEELESRKPEVRFNDPQNLWVLYVDADARNQRTGTAFGLTMIDEGDVLGLLGLNSQPLCRWVGGLGHELGHAFGLEHPTQCAPSSPSAGECGTLMYHGFRSYPSTSLLDPQITKLVQSAFFRLTSLGGDRFDCSQL